MWRLRAASCLKEGDQAQHSKAQGCVVRCQESSPAWCPVVQTQPEEDPGWSNPHLILCQVRNVLSVGLSHGPRPLPTQPSWVDLGRGSQVGPGGHCSDG